MDDEPPLTASEIKRMRAQMVEIDQLKAQGRLVLGVGLAVTGAVGWLWGDEVKAFIKHLLG